MGFNRDQFKPTSMAAIKTQEQEAAAKRPTGNNNLFGKIEDGRNTLRLYPAHPDGGGTTFAEAHCVSWLPVTSKARDENKRVIEGQTEIRRKSVFNSKVHGNTVKDLVEEYLRLVREVLFKEYLTDKAEQATIEGWLTSFESKDAIQPQDSWAVYASKRNGDVWGPVEQFDLKKTVKTALNNLAAELSNDDPNSPDPFTNVTDGIPVVVVKGKDPKNGKTVYSAAFARVGAGRQANYMDAPLSDDQLEAFLRLPSLNKIYVNAYKRRDLLLQLEGLKNIDDQLTKRSFKTKAGLEFVTGLSVFAIQEFQDLIDEMLDLYPEGEEPAEDQATEDNGPATPSSTIDKLPWENQDEDQTAPPTRNQPRQQQQPIQSSQQPLVRRQQQAAPPIKTTTQETAARGRQALDQVAAPKQQPRQPKAPVPGGEPPEKVQERLQQATATSVALDERIRQVRENMGKGKKNGAG